MVSQLSSRILVGWKTVFVREEAEDEEGDGIYFLTAEYLQRMPRV
jgi:hypothetical protein